MAAADLPGSGDLERDPSPETREQPCGSQGERGGANAAQDARERWHPDLDQVAQHAADAVDALALRGGNECLDEAGERRVHHRRRHTIRTRNDRVELELGDAGKYEPREYRDAPCQQRVRAEEQGLR